MGAPMIPSPRKPSCAIEAMILAMLPRILVTKRIYPEAIEYLNAHSELDYENTDDGLPAAQLLERARDKQAIISQLTDKFTPQVLAQLDPSVKILANVAVGFDNVDVPAATARGILVTNTPGVLTDTTPGFALALMMSAARRITEAEIFLPRGQWNRSAIDLLRSQ